MTFLGVCDIIISMSERKVVLIPTEYAQNYVEEKAVAALQAGDPEATESELRLSSTHPDGTSLECQQQIVDILKPETLQPNPENYPEIIAALADQAMLSHEPRDPNYWLNEARSRQAEAILNGFVTEL